MVLGFVRQWCLMSELRQPDARGFHRVDGAGWELPAVARADMRARFASKDIELAVADGERAGLAGRVVPLGVARG